MMNRMASVCAALCAVGLSFVSSADTITASDTVLARLQATTNLVEASTLTQGSVYPVSVGVAVGGRDVRDRCGTGSRTRKLRRSRGARGQDGEDPFLDILHRDGESQFGRVYWSRLVRRRRPVAQGAGE